MGVAECYVQGNLSDATTVAPDTAIACRLPHGTWQHLTMISKKLNSICVILSLNMK